MLCAGAGTAADGRRGQHHQDRRRGRAPGQEHGPRLVRGPADRDPGQPPRGGGGHGPAPADPPLDGGDHRREHEHDDDADPLGAPALLGHARGHEGGRHVGRRRDGHPAQVQPEGAVDHDQVERAAPAGDLGQAHHQQAQDEDQGDDDPDAGPDPALLGDQQPAGVEEHGGRREPAGGAGPGVRRPRGQPLPDGVGEQPQVDHRPDRERRAGRREQGGVRGQAAAGRLLDPGAEDADADERAQQARDLADGDQDLADAVRAGRPEVGAAGADGGGGHGGAFLGWHGPGVTGRGSRVGVHGAECAGPRPPR